VLADGDRPPFVLFDGSPAARDRIHDGRSGARRRRAAPRTRSSMRVRGHSGSSSIESSDPDTIVGHLRARIAHAAATGATPSVVVAPASACSSPARTNGSPRRRVTSSSTRCRSPGCARLGGVRVLAPAERRSSRTGKRRYRRSVEAGAPPSTTAT
jgi:hypothetical protein